MKVRELIKKLEKLPKNLEVYSADHDHGYYETSGVPENVYLIDKKNMTEFENDNCHGLHDCFKHTPQKYVVLRP